MSNTPTKYSTEVMAHYADVVRVKTNHFAMVLTMALSLRVKFFLKATPLNIPFVTLS